MKHQTHSSVTYSSLEYPGANGEMTWSDQNNHVTFLGQQPKSQSKSQSEPTMSLRRLGRASLRTLFLGSLVLPLIFVFLALLWVDSINLAVGQDPGKSWVNTLPTEWITRFVTISTAVIRTAVDFQATLATAMIAGIMLERTGIPLHKAPFYSIIRAVDVAPTNLLLAGKIRFKRVKWATFLIYTLITVEVLVTIAAQFLSTIFLSDFETTTVPSPVNVTTVPILDIDYPDHRNIWLLSPSSSWTFAEVPSEHLVVGTNFHDTGHVYRALLPLGDDGERPRLRKFTGPLPIIDHRVACVNPRLTNLTFDYDNDSYIQPRPRLVGWAHINVTSYPMLRRGKEDNEEQSGNFTCALPSGDEIGFDPSMRQTTLCWPFSMSQFRNEVYTKHGRSFWNTSMEDRLLNYDDYPGVNVGSPVVLVVELVNQVGLVAAYNNALTEDKLTGVFNTGANDGPWAVLKSSLGTDSLRVTACFSDLSFQTFEANVQSSWDAREPQVKLSPERPGSYGTEALRRQLGATLPPNPFNERGILTLEPRSEWRTFNQTTNNSTTDTDIPLYFASSLTRTLPAQSFSDSFVFLSNTPPSVRVPGEAHLFAHPYHDNLFRDTLNETKSPALALQTVLTKMTQMMYYDQIAQIGDKRAAYTTFTTTAFLPVRWTGFVGAVVIIATHLAIVITVTMLFLKVTMHSQIGSYWQAISQVVTEDTMPILEQSGSMEDKDIKTWAKSEALDIKQQGILRRREDGRVALSLVP